MTSAGLTAQAVADLVGGRLLGNGDVVLRRVGPLDHAGGDTLALAISARYLDEFRGSTAGAVLIPEALAAASGGPRTRIVVDAPQRALSAAIEAIYARPAPTPGVDATARMGRGVSIGAGSAIGPHAVLGDGVQLEARCRIGAGVTLGDGVIVGADTRIDSGVVCYAGCRIGRRVVLKAGAVVGGDGFGYVSERGGHSHLPHVGGCIIEDDVEIGSNSCIDRGSIDDTVIGRGTKLDNLVHVGHNVRIGEHCLLMGGVGVGGSTRIGNGVVLAGHVCVVDHVTIGDGVRVGAKSLVVGIHQPGLDISGWPARRHRETLRAEAAGRRLPAIVAELETMVAERSGGA